MTVLPTGALAACETPAYKPFRYDENYSYLQNPACRTDFWDPIKYIPIGGNPDVYLSFGGELRERFEQYWSPNFGLGGVSPNGYLLHRLLLSADLHVGQNFRAFVQLGSHFAPGKNEPLSPTDEDALDLQQGFFDVRLPIAGDIDPTVRIGRQELAFGSQRLVSVREPPNIRRSFDGVSVFDTIGNVTYDAFLTRPVKLAKGVFDDESLNSQAFWGLYTTVNVTPHLGIDLYYLGLENDSARFGTVSGDEQRQTLGTRFFGSSKGLDWNFEAAGQFGRFAGRDISAWTVASDTGYTLSNVLWTPRLGLKANIASGDHDPNDHTLGTFNPLFPKLGYFSEASLIFPSNFFDLQPNVTLSVTDKISVTAGWDFLWRETTNDAIYIGSGSPVPGTAGRGGRYTGSQASLNLDWRVNRHIEATASYVHFFVSDAMRQANASDVDFVMGSVAYKF
ncbi:alginate export family protein [Rhizobium mayense]|uniref:Alginate export family protein n=1 Tax=Rhizobium mayense TaxID=1312184 RepID=A0ABT7K3L3_9HYPH|nr:alginate export family protein [Rhizobium mayense]MDL2402558.1 alginate export family protein [Rhizobium mayense]